MNEGRTPVATLGLVDVVGIAAGSWHSLALLTDGSVKAWGRNDGGILGDGTDTNRTTPVTVLNVTQAVQVAAAGRSSYALLRDGTVKAWGLHRSDGVQRVPETIPGLAGVAKISVTAVSLLALLRDGRVLSWVMDSSGGSLAEVPHLQNVRDVSAGKSSLFLLDNGTVVEGGAERPIPGLSEVVGIAAAPSTAEYWGVDEIDSARNLAWLQNRTIIEWGCSTKDRFLDQMSAGDPRPKGCDPAPHPLSWVPGAKKVVNANTQSLALLADGTVKRWAWREHEAETISSLVAVFDLAVGRTHAIAIVDPTRPFPKPEMPTHLEVIPIGNDAMQITWDPPTNNGGPITSNFLIYRGTTPDALDHVSEVPGWLRSASEDGLWPATTYYYRVSAVTSVGEGPRSGMASATTAQAPPSDAPGPPYLPSFEWGPNLIVQTIGGIIAGLVVAYVSYVAGRKRGSRDASNETSTDYQVPDAPTLTDMPDDPK